LRHGLEIQSRESCNFLGRKRDEASAAAVKLSNAMMPANDKSIRQQRSSQNLDTSSDGTQKNLG